MDQPAALLEDVRARIAAAAKIARRDPAEVTLVAVSKTHPAERIAPLIAAGQRVFGENRVQEAQAKWPALREAHPGIALHLVGQLQSNKAQDAVATLTFSKRRIAQTVKKTLESAIANAENNHDLDVDSLIVAEAYVGKSIVMKRFHARGRGRASRVEKPFAHLTIVVREVEAAGEAA